MSRLYKRRCIVTIIAQNGIVVRIDKLRIQFKCQKDTKSDPNDAEISIYNLSEEKRALLAAKNTRVSLEVGYESGTGIIFIGDVTNVTPERVGVDTITKIEVRDGDNRFRNSRINASFGPGVTLNQVIDQLSSALGFPLKSKTGVPDVVFGKGVSISSAVKDALNSYTRPYDLEWSIQNETLQIGSKSGILPDLPILLNASSGLVGYPQKIKEGIEFSSLIQPDLQPGKKVVIESRFVNGFYKVQTVVHEGDNQTDTFLSNCEAT